MEKIINLPQPQEVELIWNKYHTPLHIREHMRQVNRVAVFLAEKLLRAGESVNIDLVDRASLLHDTIRVTDWEQLSYECFTHQPDQADIAVWKSQREKYSSDIPHAQVNYQIFHDKYPEMAQVIKLHDIRSTPLLQSWEEKLVNYADRRVAHDKIVTIKERLVEGVVRYNKKHKTKIKQDPLLTNQIYQLEQQIYSLINSKPELLATDLARINDKQIQQFNKKQQSSSE